MLDLSKKARLILHEQNFHLSSKECSFLKSIAKNQALTAKQLHFFLTIQDRYQIYLARNIRFNYDNMLYYIEQLEKYLAIDSGNDENEAKTE